MTIQHARALLFRGEDLGFGGASPREVITQTTAPGTSRPTVTSFAFVGSTTFFSSLLGSADRPSSAAAGWNRVLVNKSPRYWMSLTAQLAAANASQGTVTVTLPIPPLGLLFLPWALTGPATLAADNPWPLNQLGAVGTPPPLAGTTVALAVELVEER